MSLFEKNDFLFAYKALHFDRILSSAAKEVAATLVDHFNKVTGRCDPSAKRIAKLLGISRATVHRATAELCEGNEPYFVRVSHGGKHNCTSYSPQWHRFREIAKAWEARLKAGLPPENASKLRHAKSQTCDTHDRKSETQTRSNNPLNEPLRGSNAEQGSLHHGNRSDNVVRIPTFNNRLSNGLNIRSPSHAQAAETAAIRRIMDDARANDPALSDSINVEADVTMLTEAAQAEMKKPGSGLRVLLDILDEARLQKRNDGSS